jgi:phage regulator Rha-like protein
MVDLAFLVNRNNDCGNTVLTISSREIAEIAGKLHDNVICDIETMLQALRNGDSNSNHQDSNGVRIERDSHNCVTQIHLPKRECLILLFGYDIRLRTQVIDRLQELEEQASRAAISPPDPMSPAEAARAWADEYERAALAEQSVHKREAEHQSMAPKARVLKP